MLRVSWRMAAAVAGNWPNCRPLADRLLLHSVLLEASKKLLRLALRSRSVKISKCYVHFNSFHGFKTKVPQNGNSYL